MKLEELLSVDIKKSSVGELIRLICLCSHYECKLMKYDDNSYTRLFADLKEKEASIINEVNERIFFSRL